MSMVQSFTHELFIKILSFLVKYKTMGKYRLRFKRRKREEIARTGLY